MTLAIIGENLKFSKRLREQLNIDCNIYREIPNNFQENVILFTELSFNSIIILDDNGCKPEVIKMATERKIIFAISSVDLSQYHRSDLTRIINEIKDWHPNIVDVIFLNPLKELPIREEDVQMIINIIKDENSLKISKKFSCLIL